MRALRACGAQKKKKLRKKEPAEDLSFLEEEAAAAAASGGDHGSRGARSAIADTQSAERDRAAALKQQRRVGSLWLSLPAFAPSSSLCYTHASLSCMQHASWPCTPRPYLHPMLT
jgi:hypothetical protein